MRKIAELKPYPNNPKEHPPEQVTKIAESIVRYGFRGAIVITKDDYIVNGHGRVLAMQELKRDEIPCEIFTGTEEEAAAFRIADNKVAESGWNNDFLKIELSALQLSDPDAFTGFTPAEVEILLHPPEIKTDDSKGSGTAVISFTIVFDDIEQQERWFAFVKQLKLDYPDGETTAAKIISFIEDHADLRATDGDA